MSIDFEKFAEAFAKRGLVPSFHFHEGTQIHDNKIGKFILNGEEDCRAKEDAAPEEKASAEYESDPLYFVLGRDVAVYEEVVSVARHCEVRSDISSRLGPILRRKIGRQANTVKTATLIIPHLVNYKCVKNPRYIANTAYNILNSHPTTTELPAEELLLPDTLGITYP